MKKFFSILSLCIIALISLTLFAACSASDSPIADNSAVVGSSDNSGSGAGEGGGKQDAAAFFTPDKTSYVLYKDYTLTNADENSTDLTGSVRFSKAVSVDLNGHTLDLGGKTFVVDSDEPDCVVTFKSGKIINGGLIVNVPNGEIVFDGVETGENVYTELTAAPSTIILRATVSKGVIRVGGSSRVIIDSSNIASIGASGASSIEVDGKSEIGELSAEGDGADIEVAEDAKVGSIKAAAVVEISIAGVVNDLVVAENAAISSSVSVKVIIIVVSTAKVGRIELDSAADVEIAGEVENLSVSEKAASETLSDIRITDIATVKTAEINAPAAISVEGYVGSVDFGGVSENSIFTVEEGGNVDSFATVSAIIADIYGNVSDVSVSESVIDGQKVIVITIYLGATVDKMDVSGAAEVNIGGEVGFISVSPSLNPETSLKPSVNVSKDASVGKIDAETVIILVIEGNVEELFIDADAENSEISVLDEAVIGKLVDDAFVKWDISDEVVIEIIIVLEDAEISEEVFEQVSESISVVSQDEIDKIRNTHHHIYVVAERVLPTCDENGYILYRCIDGDDEYTVELTESHRYVLFDVKEPNCLEGGCKTYVCANCGDEKIIELDKTAHPYEVIDLVLPSLTEEGCCDLECSYCKRAERVTLPAFNGYDYRIVYSVPATCTEDGNYSGIYNYDGFDIEVSFTTPATGHNYEESVIYPDCTHGGYTLHNCSVCGDNYTTDITEKLGHSYSGNVCERCGVHCANAFTGTVYRADSDANLTNNVRLENVVITIEGVSELGEEIVAETATNSNGGYTVNNIPYGTYTLTAMLDGYKENVQQIKINLANQQNDYLLLVEDTGNAFGGISGTVVDAATGSGVAGMTVLLRAGTNNVTGEVLYSTTTLSSGAYSLSDVEIGNYTLQIADEREIAEISKYNGGKINVAVIADTTVSNQNVTISKSLSADSMRIVLTWGSSPSDLDSYLTIGNNYTVNYSNKSAGNATLDVDDTSSYGPETITISKISEGTTYHYYVHDYSNKNSSSSTYLANSGAKVTVYFGNASEPYYVFNVPSGRGYYWDVFTFNTQTGFNVINRVSTYVS